MAGMPLHRDLREGGESSRRHDKEQTPVHKRSAGATPWEASARRESVENGLGFEGVIKPLGSVHGPKSSEGRVVE